MKKFVCSFIVSIILLFAFTISTFALSDGTYAIDYDISTKTGNQKCLLPAKLVIENGENFVQLVFDDPEVDKLYLNNEVILPIGTTKSGYKNDISTYQVFNLPIDKFNTGINFTLHTRGNNLQTDVYTITVSEYDENFNAKAQSEDVENNNIGTKTYRFYNWDSGSSFSIWQPFVLLTITTLAFIVFFKKFEKNQ